MNLSVEERARAALGSTHADSRACSATIWTLRKGDHVAAAEIRSITGVGLDLRYLANGVLRETRLFRGTAAGTEAVDTALTKREELEAKGWRANR
jgi:hypothetical protein